MTSIIQDFAINVSDSVLLDLQHRLRNTRWPDEEPVADWSQGVPIEWIREMANYWQQQYNWREREALLNRFEQAKFLYQGLSIHFIHQRSSIADATPLLITHGWPGSIVEFHKVIEPLTNPVAFGGNAEDAFHVICPSLPGFGFSDKPLACGWGVEKIAECWTALMQALGYRKYIAQGGDWGSAVTRQLGAIDAKHCSGIHITLAMGSKPLNRDSPNEVEKETLNAIKHYQKHDSGYSKQQATRPQTLAYGLCDSPVGQLAWILEKFYAWTDCKGHPENLFSKDELLDNVMLYWVTNSAASSARLYWESFGNAPQPDVDIPTGVSRYPKEIVPPVKGWMQAGGFNNIVYWRDMDEGGHFAAFEQPEIFVEDIRRFARALDSR